MTKWECLVCGYICDPAQGDPDNRIEQGTPFQSLPDDWISTECGAGQDDFEPIWRHAQCRVRRIPVPAVRL